MEKTTSSAAAAATTTGAEHGKNYFCLSSWVPFVASRAVKPTTESCVYSTVQSTLYTYSIRIRCLNEAIVNRMLVVLLTSTVSQAYTRFACSLRSHSTSTRREILCFADGIIDNISIVIWAKSNQFSYTVARAHRSPSFVPTHTRRARIGTTFPIFFYSITRFKMNFSSSFELFTTRTRGNREYMNVA